MALDRATLFSMLEAEMRLNAPCAERVELLKLAINGLDAPLPVDAGTRVRVRKSLGFGYTYGTVSAEPPPVAVRVDWDDATSSLVAAEHLEVSGDA